MRDSFKRTALFYSLYYSSFDTIEYLIANGADTLFLDFKGRTVIHYSVILGCDKKIIELLIDYNNDLDMCKAHFRDALEEFRERPIKNFDFTPSA